MASERDEALEEAAQMVEQSAGPLCMFGALGGLKGDVTGQAKANVIAEILPLIADEIRGLKSKITN